MAYPDFNARVADVFIQMQNIDPLDPAECESKIRTRKPRRVPVCRAGRRVRVKRKRAMINWRVK